MRKLLPLLALLLFLSSCAVVTFPMTTTISLMDFRPYTEQGFFISSEPYYGKYDPIGVVNISITPEMDVEEGNFTDQVLRMEKVNLETILDTCVKEAKALGADGISSFKLNISDRATVYEADSTSYYVTAKTYEVTGQLIRRL